PPSCPALPAGLVAASERAARVGLLAEAFPSHVVALARGVQRTMALASLRPVAVLVLLMAVFGLAAFAAVPGAPEEEKVEAPPAPPGRPKVGLPPIRMAKGPLGLDLRPRRELGGSHSLSVNCLAYSPDGKTVVTGGGEGAVKLWDVTSGRNVATLRGHPEMVK